jgi:hypothetical protein
MSDQYIIIHQDGDPFARVPKALLADDRLSWRAKGVIAYLLGKTADWKIRITDIVNQSTDGKDSVRSAIEELKSAGYAKSECVKSDIGQFTEWRLHVSDRPIFSNVSPDTGCPELGKPDLGKPEVAQPDLGKPTLNKNDITKNEVLVRKECTSFLVPTMDELVAYAQQIGFPEVKCKEFFAYYEMNGWRVGRNKMKCWKKAMSYWKSKDESKPLSVWEIKQKCEAVVEALKTHPCNRSSLRHNPHATDEEKADYERLRVLHEDLKKRLIK